MLSKPIRLTDFDVKPNARVVISGNLNYADITHKNLASQYTPTYGVVIANPTYTAPDTNKDSSNYKNDVNLAQYLHAHEQREIKRYGHNRLHLIWKDGGALKGHHMPIVGRANQSQLSPIDSGDLLAKRDQNNHILGRDGRPILVKGKPVNTVSSIPNADDKVAFNQLALDQRIQVTYVSFKSMRYGRLGSTIRALVVPDLDHLKLFTRKKPVSFFGLTPSGDNTVNIDFGSKVSGPNN